MDGAAGTCRNMASLDRKLERVLAAYRPVRLPGETDSRGPSNSGQGASFDDEGDSTEPLHRQANARASASLRDCSHEDSLRESSREAPPQGYSSGVSAITMNGAVERSQVAHQRLPDSRKELGIRSHNKAESASTAWTDDRHSSYLNSIEETFVRNMYDTDYETVNAFGSREHADPSEQDCVESRAPDRPGTCTSNPTELFELWQGGTWQSFYRPHPLEVPAPAPPAVLHSPWVQHFNRRASTSSGGGTAAAHLDMAAADDELVDENVLPDEVAEPKQVAQPDSGFLAWQNRLHQQISKPSSDASRKEAASGATGKRGISESEDVVRVDSIRSKRLKCQQTLAFIDLEMEDKFSLGPLEADVGDHVAGCNGKPAHDQPEATQVDEQPPLQVIPSQKIVNGLTIAERKEVLGTRSMQRVLLRNNLCIRGLPPVDVDQVVPLFGSFGAEDNSERVVVPDINCQPKQGANDGICDCKGCLDVSRTKSDHASTDSKFGVTQMVREAPSGTEAVLTAHEEKAVPICNTVEQEDETPHRKRRSFHTWNWGLQGLRRPLLDKARDSAE